MPRGRGTAQSHHYDPDARASYWWRTSDNGSWLRVFRCLKSGYKLDREYTAVVVTAAREGDVVRIRHPHGLDRSRNRCPVCAILMADGPAPTCRRCGTRYRQ